MSQTTTHQIRPMHPACYGVCCALHAECQRYAAVEDTPIDDTMATCDDGNGHHPGFAPEQPATQSEA